MFTLNCKGRLLTIEKPIVMGIINATPDSFYSGSRQSGVDSILAKAEQMLLEGATILDIGGQSTRPNSNPIGIEEELQRVVEPIAAIQKHFPEAYISIDTYFAKVAQEAVAAGACMVNDISAGSIDSAIIDTVIALQVPYVLMHIQGSPQTMQQHPQYENISLEILDFFIQKTSPLKEKGLVDIIIDPGFGFGKTIAHNYELLRQLHVFEILSYPILLGLSRKSMIYKPLGITAAEALSGSTALHTIGLLNGAALLRVHDVKEAMQVIALTDLYKNKSTISGAL